jgi:hypothetical protein
MEKISGRNSFSFERFIHIPDFQQSINKRQRTGLPMELCLIFQQMFSTRSILPYINDPI